MHVTAAVLVTGRYWGRTLPFLNMYADAKELVFAADTEAKPDASWVGEATFTGSAHPLVDEQTVNPKQVSVDLSGTVSIAETSTHHFLLFASADTADPAVWISAPHGTLNATQSGSQVVIAGDGWQITTADVMRLFLSTDPRREHMGKERQEGHLVASLQRPGTGRAPAALPFADAADTGDWRAAPSGLFVQVADGHPTGRTSLSAPQASQRERLAQLLGLGWLPLNVLARQYRLRIGDQEQGRWSAAAPPDRSWAPVSDAFVGFGAGPRLANEIADYLWPQVSPVGQPVLAPGESMIQAWTTTNPRLENVDAQGNDDLPYSLMPTKGQAVECLLTNERLIMVAALSTADHAALVEERADSHLFIGKKPQVGLLDTATWNNVRKAIDTALGDGRSPYYFTSHVRWEWLAAIGRHTEEIERTERPKGIFGKKVVTNVTVAWLQLDVLLPDGSRRRLHIEARDGEVAALNERLHAILGAVAGSGTAAVASQPEVTARPLMHGKATTERWAVTGKPGYSLPRVHPRD
jgi:hypothetical protein